MAGYISLDFESYEAARNEFSWELPEDFNAAYDLVGKHGDGDELVALEQVTSGGTSKSYTFDEIDGLSNQLANGFVSLGVERGDRVAVAASQKLETLLVHLACWKIGAISVPLSVLFGTDALEYRLDDSGASVVVAAPSLVDTVLDVAEDCYSLSHVISIGTPTPDGCISFEDVCADESREMEPADTGPKTPAIIIYTSGSTGQPKGVLHRHELWVGHLPAVNMYFEHNVKGDAVYWTPADWAWIGALGDIVFPAWHYGRPVVGHPMGKFDPITAFQIMEEFDVTNTFIPPTALRMMMEVQDVGGYDIDLNAICSGGEPLTSEIIEWADTHNLRPVNELYGQTEANLIVCNCRQWFPAELGSMGKPVPGHEVAILDTDTGERLPPGEPGEIAIRRTDDPVVFTEYWNEPEQTDRVTLDDWHCTGDIGVADEEGYLWFKSRDDDLIITSGYRVSPYEVEDALLGHESVDQVGVVGVPDERRGEVIKAFVQLTADVTPSDELRRALQKRVQRDLAKYEYPREIEFVTELPMTTTGKIRRTKLREMD